MKDGKSIKERTKKLNLAKVKEIADGVAKAIDIVVGIVMSVMLAVVGIQQNADMAQQEAQLAAMQLQMDFQAQAPTFKIVEDHTGERFEGYKLINEGRLVECLDVRLEKWLYIQTMGNPAAAFIVPYNMVNMYISTPAKEERIGFYVERAAAEDRQEISEVSDSDDSLQEAENVESQDSFEAVNLMDAGSFVKALSAKLHQEAVSGYSIQSMEVLSLSFIDQEQTYEKRRYVAGVKAREDETGEHPLYVIDENMWIELLGQIPEGFERMPDILNGSAYSYLAQSGAQWRHSDDAWQESLIEDIARYIDSIRSKSSSADAQVQASARQTGEI